MNGKGSKRRPMKITQKEFEENWERVFGKSNPNFAVMTLDEIKKKYSSKPEKKKK